MPKRGPAAFVKHIAKRTVKDVKKGKRNPVTGLLANPEVVQLALPALVTAIAGFLVTGPIGQLLIGMHLKDPKSGVKTFLANHARPLVGSALMGGVWYGTKKSKKLHKYETGVLIGAGINLAWAIWNTYIKPKPMLSLPGAAATNPSIDSGAEPADDAQQRLIDSINARNSGIDDGEVQLEDYTPEPAFADDGLGEFQTGIFSPKN